MTLKEAVNKYGLGVWLESEDLPGKKLFRPEKIAKDDQDEFICIGDLMHKGGVQEFCGVRTNMKNPSTKFVLHKEETND